MLVESWSLFSVIGFSCNKLFGQVIYDSQESEGHEGLSVPGLQQEEETLVTTQAENND